MQGIQKHLWEDASFLNSLIDAFREPCGSTNYDAGSTLAPPGNWAANGENEHQPIVSEETGLLDSISKLTAVRSERYGFSSINQRIDD